MDAFSQCLVRKWIFLRVLGHFRAGGQGQPRTQRAVCQEHVVRLLVPLFLWGRLRQGLPNPQPRSRDATEPPGAVSRGLPCSLSSSSSGFTTSKATPSGLFNIENPLWVFVGGRVTATLAKKDATDILEILQFLDRYVADRAGSIRRASNGFLIRAWSPQRARTCSPGASSTSIFADSRRRRFSMRLLRHSSTPLVAAGSISRT